MPDGGLVITYTDITERKAMEMELVKAREAAEAAAETKANFLATMSHEIRTPMNGVMSMSEILDQTRLTADQRSMTKTIRQSADALLTVINDILDFSKIEAGKLDIEEIEFDLVDVIESTADLMAPRAEAKSIDFLVEVDADIPRRLPAIPAGSGKSCSIWRATRSSSPRRGRSSFASRSPARMRTTRRACAFISRSSTPASA